MKHKLIILLSALVGNASVALAQHSEEAGLPVLSKNGWEVEMNLGVNIGGAAPIPMPREIRKIEHFNPKFNGSAGLSLTKWFGKAEKWGVSLEANLEKKGMKTAATVKAYHMAIEQDGTRIEGYYTGYVKTNYSSTFLTIPVLVNYRLSDRWKLRAGGFASVKLDGRFDGTVSDGYLREGTPTGSKITFENGTTAPYNFASDLRKVHWGARIGGAWRADKHVSLHADLAWVFSDIFKKEFDTITFALHPIYLNLGVGYKF